MTTSTPAAALTRREADRLAYLDCVRAAEAMRADARRWREMANDLIADIALYGPRADDYRAGTVARLELVAGWAEAEADRMSDYAASYWALLIGSEA